MVDIDRCRWVECTWAEFLAVDVVSDLKWVDMEVARNRERFSVVVKFYFTGCLVFLCIFNLCSI